jgi:RNA polymerase sigma-70 factor (ECF subfamily)
MDERDWLAGRFEEHQTRLRAVAYRMLGSLSEADDAVQEAWLRLNRSDASEVENLGAWLTTVVARISLNMLRSRDSRASSRRACTCPSRSSTAPTGPTPSTRRSWPTRSVSRCSWCSRR